MYNWLTPVLSRTNTGHEHSKRFSVGDRSDFDRLRDLDRRIQSAKKGTYDEKPKLSDHHSAAHLAWRMVIELVVGLAIGLGIGYGLDSVFDTMPLFLVFFILLGFAAGVKTMMRSAKEVQENATALGAEKEKE